MTLSILIPTYNYDALALVSAMREQISVCGIDAEIIVGDDASDHDNGWLAQLDQWPEVRVLRAAHNLGRAANRNRMAEAAHGQWLLMTDCDALLPPSFSLTAYMEAARQAPVVCGGLRHPDTNPCPEATLRYKYERHADRHRSAAERMVHPYAQFSTFNFLIRRDVFLGIRFDEACKDYGYEDALFGVELKHRGIPLLHIDNALVHIGLEPNDVFLRKSETALRTLHTLNGRMSGHSRVENMAVRLQRLHLAGIARTVYRLSRPLLQRNLLGQHPSLAVFAFYKLGFFLTL